MNPNWPKDFRVTLPKSGPGVHQIRLRQSQNGVKTSQNRITVACVCGATLASINPGDDCWGPFRVHEAEVEK